MHKQFDLSIKQFDDRSQKHPTGFKLPDWMPKHEFLMLVVAPAGSGKTTLLLNILISIYKGYWHKIAIFSPTIHTDAKWEHLKEENNILMPMKKGQSPQNSDSDNEGTSTQRKPLSKKELVKQMEDMMYERDPLIKIKNKKGKSSYKAVYAKDKQQKLDVKENKLKHEVMKMDYLMRNILQFPTDNDYEARFLRKLSGHHYNILQLQNEKEDLSEAENINTLPGKRHLAMKESDFHEEYDESALDEIMDQQDRLTEKLKKQKKSLVENMPRLLWVFDDMVGSGLFNLRRDNSFKRLCVRRRHFYSSVIAVTQAYKEIPKTSRTNNNILILFRIDSDEELLAIYREYPMGLKHKEWLAVYNYCTRDPYTFIMFNLQTSNPDYKISKNFNEPLSLAFIHDTITTSSSS